MSCNALIKLLLYIVTSDTLTFCHQKLLLFILMKVVTENEWETSTMSQQPCLYMLYFGKFKVNTMDALNFGEQYFRLLKRKVSPAHWFHSPSSFRPCISDAERTALYNPFISMHFTIAKKKANFFCCIDQSIRVQNSLISPVTRSLLKVSSFIHHIKSE